jgi:predicted metalloprotease with PDZ domain
MTLPLSKAEAHPQTIAVSLALLACLATLSFGPAVKAAVRAEQAVTEAPLQLEYHLRIARPSTHLAEVEIDARGVHAPTLDFVLPAWSPGRYAIYDFAKNVQEFEASGSDGRSIPWSQPDKQTWHVEAASAGGEIRVRYRIFGNDLNGSFSQIDATHANLNGASIYMYVDGHKPDPIHLQVDPPEGWKVVSGFSLSIDQHAFDAPNYDRLIDTPMEISPAISIDQFTDRGKTFRVAVHAYDGGETERPSLLNELVEGVKKIVAADLAMMPAPDFDHYTFIFHFAPDIAEGDGMEHLNSTQIIISQPLSDAGVREALGNTAHEFFHLWNVKRLRPAALGPFDYTREDYTPSLWLAEGITSYYAYLAEVRSGLWGPADLFEQLAAEIAHLETDPGRRLMSAESSSFHAWFYDRAPQMQETNFANATISYYNKGALLGLLLDLEIRARTEGRKSLDDVMRLMYERFYRAPAATYYLPGRGYEERDILQAVNEVSGSDFGDFFRRYVEGLDPLPYNAVLAKAGLVLKSSTAPGAAPSLGILAEPEPTGVRIVDVRPGGAADRAGLSRDDLLVAVDNFSLATASLDDRLRIYPVGAEVPFTVQRHTERQIITVKLDPPPADQYSIELSPDATPSEVKIRNAWLRGVASDR